MKLNSKSRIRSTNMTGKPRTHSRIMSKHIVGITARLLIWILAIALPVMACGCSVEL